VNFVSDPSLVLYLPLYCLDGSSFMSKDAYGHLCTVTGALWRPNGRSFDGEDDKITVPDGSLWDTGDEVTVSCWFKTTTAQTSRSLVLHDLNSYKYMLFITINSTKIKFYTRTALGMVIPEATGIWDDGVWHNAVGVYKRSDGERGKLYVDGDLVGTDTGYDEPIMEGDEGMHIGLYSNSYFEGTIGEVMVYNRALAPSEVQRNYLATKWRYQ
jgi:hypothetical protein